MWYRLVFFFIAEQDYQTSPIRNCIYATKPYSRLTVRISGAANGTYDLCEIRFAASAACAC